MRFFSFAFSLVANTRRTPGASVAIGELDASSPGPEIATCTTDKQLIVFSAAEPC